VVLLAGDVCLNRVHCEPPSSDGSQRFRIIFTEKVGVSFVKTDYFTIRRRVFL
jgi:hypothetical protein